MMKKKLQKVRQETVITEIINLMKTRINHGNMITLTKGRNLSDRVNHTMIMKGTSHMLMRISMEKEDLFNRGYNQLRRRNNSWRRSYATVL